MTIKQIQDKMLLVVVGLVHEGRIRKVRQVQRAMQAAKGRKDWVNVWKRFGK